MSAKPTLAGAHRPAARAILSVALASLSTILALSLVSSPPASADGCIEESDGRVHADRYYDPHRRRCNVRRIRRLPPPRRPVVVRPPPPPCWDCRPPRPIPIEVRRPEIIVAPAPIWCGTYVGGHLGLSYATLDFERQGVTASRAGTVFSFGGHAGHNWQYGGLVFGLEADIGYRGATGARAVPAFGPAAMAAGGVPWLATGRARFGFAFDRTLLYATGGLALGNVHATLTTPGQSLTIEQWRLGTVWGLGLEHMITEGLSGRIEVLRTDLGSERISAGGLSTRVGASETSVRAGLSIRF